MAILDYIGTKYDGDKEKVIKETQYFRDRIGIVNKHDHSFRWEVISLL